MVNLINGLFSYWQEHKAEKAVEAPARMLPVHVRVIRDGTEREVLAEKLVPGDVVLLREGDLVSADARLVQESELRVDQSSLTGESRPVRRSAELAIVLSVIYLLPLQLIFKTAAFPPENWLYHFAWMPSLLLADEIRKAMLRRRKNQRRTAKGGKPKMISSAVEDNST